MNTSQLLLEIRKIVREEIQIALSTKSKSVTESISAPRLVKKKQPQPVQRNENSDAIKEKLKAMQHLQKKYGVEMTEEDLSDETPEPEFKAKTPTQKHVMEQFNRDYSAVLKKTGDIK